VKPPLAILGLIIMAVGALLFLASLFPHPFRLPGDLLIKRANFTFYFPITTCIIASIILTLIIALIMRWRWPF